MKIYDISMLIHPDMRVYPGNPAPRIDRYKNVQDDGVNESLYTLSVLITWLRLIKNCFAETPLIIADSFGIVVQRVP